MIRLRTETCFFLLAHVAGWDPFPQEVSTFGIVFHAAENGIRPQTKYHFLFFDKPSEVFLKAFCNNGFAFAITGRGFRSRNPIVLNNRWH